MSLMPDIGTLISPEEWEKYKSTQKAQKILALSVCGLPEALVDKVSNVEQWTHELQGRNMSQNNLIRFSLESTYGTVTVEYRGRYTVLPDDNG